MSRKKDNQPAIKPAVVDKTYREAVALAEEASIYFRDQGLKDKTDLETVDRSIYVAESLRVSTRLMHAISWLMTQMAVEAGEITREDAAKSTNMLGGKDICLGEPDHSTENMPDAMLAMMAKSANIYERAMHLETLLTGKAKNGGKNPVARMILKLESEY